MAGNVSSLPQWVSDGDPRVLKCWALNNCGACLASSDKCAWCPYSATCVALPRGAHLLSPVRDKHICPMPWQERWELRTKTFGCNCSTTTLLAAIITCLSTLVALAVLIGLVKLTKLAILSLRARRGGWEVQQHPSGERTERIWVRKQPAWGAWFKSKWKRQPIDSEHQPLLIE